MKKINVDDIINSDFSSVTKDECVAVIRYLYNEGKSMEAMLDRQARLLAVVEEFKRMAEAKPYIPSTESMPLLFDEIDIIACFTRKLEEEEKETVKEHERKKRTPQTVLPADTPVVTYDNTKDAPQSKTVDGILYERCEDTVVFKVSHIPASTILEKHITPAYRAAVEMEDARRQKLVAFRNPETDGLAAAPSMLAHIAVSKFDDHLPLYRQEEIFARSGLKIGRQKMANWLVAWYSSLAGFSRWLEDRVFSMQLIQQDETPIEVLDVRAPSGKVSSNCYAVIRVATDLVGGKPRRLCALSFSEGRGHEKLLDGYSRNGYTGLVMTDGLKGYLRIDNERHAVCWVHAVRQFKQVLKMDKKNNDAFRMSCKAAELFAIDEKLRRKLESGKMDEATFLLERRRLSEPVIEEFLGMSAGLRRNWPENSAMGKAFTYIEDYKDLLPNYLDSAACPPDNNACERIAKCWATGRKNWLFSKSIDGVDASCFYYSLIETAKANGVNPELYLEHILTFGTEAKTKDDYEKLLPWNVDLGRTMEARRLRAEAKPDPERTEPYVLCGFSR